MLRKFFYHQVKIYDKIGEREYMQENKKLNTKSNTATPYDDVHLTMINDCPKLIIPVVNEMFHKRHRDEEEVTVLNNEFFINRQNGTQAERVTDTHFLIGHDRYHLECQSSTDGTIMYRIFEYDSQIAMQDSAFTKDKLVVKFPNTAILYLRHNQNTPDAMTLEIRVPGATCSYMVPVMKVQTYSIDEIFEKRLFFLIPFHIFIYEKDFKEYDTNEQKLEELMKIYGEIMERLEAYSESQLIESYTKLTVIDMSKKVLEHLTKKYSNVREGVGTVMGGKILDYPTKDAWRKARAEGLAEGRAEGLAEGRAEGRAEGDRNRLVMQVRKKLEKGLSVEAIAEALEEEMPIIEEIIVELEKE